MTAAEALAAAANPNQLENFGNRLFRRAEFRRPEDSGNIFLAIRRVEFGNLLTREFRASSDLKQRDIRRLDAWKVR
ncbi:unnamed protein product [Rhizophagus irregularis]|nr:unnamed protein product [Rhizophagus irregularis]CAB5350720.1 unnamed protein product [Rhizophagus irregularis]